MTAENSFSRRRPVASRRRTDARWLPPCETRLSLLVFVATIDCAHSLSRAAAQATPRGRGDGGPSSRLTVKSRSESPTQTTNDPFGARPDSHRAQGLAVDGMSGPHAPGCGAEYVIPLWIATRCRSQGLRSLNFRSPLRFFQSLPRVFRRTCVSEPIRLKVVESPEGCGRDDQGRVTAGRFLSALRHRLSGISVALKVRKRRDRTFFSYLPEKTALAHLRVYASQRDLMLFLDSPRRQTTKVERALRVWTGSKSLTGAIFSFSLVDGSWVLGRSTKPALLTEVAQEAQRVIEIGHNGTTRKLAVAQDIDVLDRLEKQIALTTVTALHSAGSSFEIDKLYLYWRLIASEKDKLERALCSSDARREVLSGQSGTCHVVVDMDWHADLRDVQTLQDLMEFPSGGSLSVFVISRRALRILGDSAETRAAFWLSFLVSQLKVLLTKHACHSAVVLSMFAGPAFREEVLGLVSPSDNSMPFHILYAENKQKLHLGKLALRGVSAEAGETKGHGCGYAFVPSGRAVRPPIDSPEEASSPFATERFAGEPLKPPLSSFFHRDLSIGAAGSGSLAGRFEMVEIDDES